MILDMITADQARSKVFIDMMNNDLKQIKKLILNALSRNLPYVLAMDEGIENTDYYNHSVKLFNRSATIDKLKELGYTIKQCPHYDHVFVIQWEESYVEDKTDMAVPVNWDKI